MRPVLLTVAACALALPLAACGGSGSASSPPVRLTVTDPADQGTVRDDTVAVRGTVSPAGAKVTVRGQRADVQGSSFSVQVKLDAGVNVIDVLASDGDAKPALTAVRVRRILTVSVPDVVGLAPDEARSRLQDAGLKVDVQQDPGSGGGGILDELLGQKPKVCDTQPAAGEAVDLGSTVQMTVARGC